MATALEVRKIREIQAAARAMGAPHLLPASQLLEMWEELQRDGVVTLSPYQATLMIAALLSQWA